MKDKVYKGYRIKYQGNMWGDKSFFVYDPDGRLAFDEFDTQSEAIEAIENHLA